MWLCKLSVLNALANCIHKYILCCCTGSVNVNFTGMMKKRFMSGKIGLYDLVPTEEGREKFKVRMNRKNEGPGMCMYTSIMFLLACTQ